MSFDILYLTRTDGVCGRVGSTSGRLVEISTDCSGNHPSNLTLLLPDVSPVDCFLLPDVTPVQALPLPLSVCQVQMPMQKVSLSSQLQL